MRNRPLLSVCLIVLCVMTSCVLWGGERFVKDLRPSRLEIYTAEEDRVIVCGEIYRWEIKENGQMIYLKQNSVYSISNKLKFQESKIIIYTKSKEKLHIGNRIKAEGKVSFYENARNPGNFDQKLYYQKQGIHGKVCAGQIQIVDEKTDGFRESLENFRNSWKELLIREMGERDGKVMAAILLGEKNDMDQEMKELYQVNGIGHILAISGLHLSFAGLGIYRFFRRITGSYKAGAAAGGILLFLYVSMIGMTVSVIRAWVMFLFRIGADITGRRYDMPTALAVAAVIAVGSHPLYLYDGGFWLSFGAVAAICSVAPLAKEETMWPPAVRRLWPGVSMNCVLWPVVLYYFFEIPLYGIVLNLLVVPLMSVLLSCGMIGSFIRMAGVIPGTWILVICRRILKIYDGCCMFILKLPMARWVVGKPDKWRCIVYYLILFVIIMLWKYWNHEKGGERKYVIFLMLYMGALLILISGPAVRSGIEVTMLDVGQGDCICVQGPEHQNYLIDGGSSDVNEVGKYRIEPFLKSRGIAEIDYVFLSHGDLDHMCGIEEMLMRQDVGVRIRNLVVPEKTYWDEKLTDLIHTAGQNGTDIWVMEYGMTIKEGKMKWECLGPGRKNRKRTDNADNADNTGNLDSVTDTVAAGNAASMILHLEYEGFDMLFTGDVEKEGEECLTEVLADIQKEKNITWEVLKTAHHGSKNSTTERFLWMVHPQYAWISAGRKNRYGHPHEETLKRLEESGAKIYSTQQNGAIAVTVRKKTMRIHGGNS